MFELDESFRVGNPELAKLISTYLESRGKRLHTTDMTRLEKIIKQHFILLFVITVFHKQLRIHDFQCMTVFVNKLYNEINNLLFDIREYIKFVDESGDTTSSFVTIDYISNFVY